jgi:predicted glycosyltransferase
MFSGILNQQPYRDITQLRQELYSDTGQENETKVIQLAIAQLKFGMTVEARLLLQDLHNSTRQTRLLTKISQIIDQSLAVQDDMKQYQNCNNSLYFWHFLTAWIQTSSATVDLKAAISSAMASAGVLHPRVFLGRLFIRFATSFSHVWLAPFRSVPLGMY